MAAYISYLRLLFILLVITGISCSSEEKLSVAVSEFEKGVESSNWHKCTNQKECIIVDTLCGGYKSINRKSKEAYQSRYNEYSALVNCLWVEKHEGEPVADCVENRCTYKLVKN